MGVRYFGASVRSVHAHALIRDIDARAARALPGVVAVFTLADLGDAAAAPMPEMAPAPMIRQPRTQYPLAKDSVHYVGEAVALVVAENRAVAEDAAATVAVDYEPLPAMIDWRQALDAQAPRAHEDAPDNLVAELRGRFGNPDSVFASAPHVFRESFVEHRGGCHAMECRGVLARPDPAGDR